MKIFITGNNAVGKSDVLCELEKFGISDISIGKRFASLEGLPNECYLDNSTYEYLENTEIIKLFESKSYFFIHENSTFDVSFFEGLSMWSYNKGNVFVLTPSQFLEIPKFEKDNVIVWMDGSVKNRRTRYLENRKKYNFTKLDEHERSLSKPLIEKIYQNENVLYFNNEEPSRVAAIIASLILHPELLKIYRTNFY